MDVYPDALAAQGVVESGSRVFQLLGWLALKERVHAASIVALGPRAARRIDRPQAQWTPLWGPERASEEAARQMRRARGWGDEMVLLYSGNLGLGHRFGEFLEAARRLGPRRAPMGLLRDRRPTPRGRARRERHGLARPNRARGPGRARRARGPSAVRPGAPGQPLRRLAGHHRPQQSDRQLLCRKAGDLRRRARQRGRRLDSRIRRRLAHRRGGRRGSARGDPGSLARRALAAWDGRASVRRDALRPPGSTPSASAWPSRAPLAGRADRIAR